MGSSDSDESYANYEIKEQDMYLPIANVTKIMKKALPPQGKLSKEAREAVQECVSEFISFITSQAAEKCSIEKRKTLNGEDILHAMDALGFEHYAAALKIHLAKYRQMETSMAERKRAAYLRKKQQTKEQRERERRERQKEELYDSGSVSPLFQSKPMFSLNSPFGDRSVPPVLEQSDQVPARSEVTGSEVFRPYSAISATEFTNPFIVEPAKEPTEAAEIFSREPNSESDELRRKSSSSQQNTQYFDLLNYDEMI